MRLAAIITDGMVLQRDRVNHIWGEAEPGEEIEIIFLDKSYRAIADADGSFCVGMDPAKAGGPYEMRIYAEHIDAAPVKYKTGIVHDESSDRDTVTVRDILIGEVWFAGGQSNMELELQNCDHGLDEVHTAGYSDIRFYNTPKYPAVDQGLYEVESDTKWRYVTGDECREMSAVAYYFAVKLHDTLGVPIGIVDCYIGGTSVTCWIPEEDAYKPADDQCPVKPDTTALMAYLDEWRRDIDSIPDEKYEKELGAYTALVDEWNQKVEALKKEDPDIRMEEINEKAGLYPWPPPRGARSQYRPFGLYESMVRRVAPYGIRGFIYYQGEEDVDRSESYGLLLSRLIDRWRKDFGEPGLPFFITQLPMFVDKADTAEKDIRDIRKFTGIREQQAAVCASKKADGMAVLIDCGEYDNIHPTDKKTPGERLALQVMGSVYKCVEEYKAPEAVEVRFDGSEAVIRCDNTYGRLCYIRTNEAGPLTGVGLHDLSDEERRDRLIPVGTSPDENGVYGFEVSEDGERFVKARICADGDTIRVTSDEAGSISAVRYGWFDYGVANLYNAAGLPMAPFFKD
ncbi:MAG: hypothetical protein IJ807_07315 [Eubacterium sp.]|nr:hypothetical protein [Eubacterium sp.]